MDPSSKVMREPWPPDVAVGAGALAVAEVAEAPLFAPLEEADPTSAFPLDGLPPEVPRFRVSLNKRPSYSWTHPIPRPTPTPAKIKIRPVPRPIHSHFRDLRGGSSAQRGFSLMGAAAAAAAAGVMWPCPSSSASLAVLFHPREEWAREEPCRGNYISAVAIKHT